MCSYCYHPTPCRAGVCKKSGREAMLDQGGFPETYRLNWPLGPGTNFLRIKNSLCLVGKWTTPRPLLVVKNNITKIALEFKINITAYTNAVSYLRTEIPISPTVREHQEKK